MPESFDLSEAFAVELMEPINYDKLRQAIRYIHNRIADDKPLKGEYRDYLLEALDKIANGSRPDTAFKFRQHEINPSNKSKIFQAMKKIYYRSIDGNKITLIIDEVAKDNGFSYEVLRKEWYKGKCAWKKAFEEHDNDMRQFYHEKLQEHLKSIVKK